MSGFGSISTAELGLISDLAGEKSLSGLLGDLVLFGMLLGSMACRRGFGGRLLSALVGRFVGGLAFRSMSRLVPRLVRRLVRALCTRRFGFSLCRLEGGLRGHR